MRSRSNVLIIIICLVINSHVPTSSAAISISGKSCAKLGKVKIVDEKLYSCKYVGKRLVWSKGISKSFGDEPKRITSKYWISQTCEIGNQDCPAITPETQLANIESCKIADATTYREADSTNDISSNGFPRPKKTYKNGSFPIVLIVPVSYSDLPFDINLENQLDLEYEKASTFYETNSYGASRIHFETLPRKSWITIPMSWKEWSKQNNDDLITITKATLEKAFLLDFSKYDSIFLGTSKSSSLYWGGGTHEVYENSFGELKNVYFTVGGKTLGLEHNLGHTLFQLEDLYIHPWNTEAISNRGGSVIRYDIMSGGSDYLAWNRWLNGWLKDSEINCVSSGAGETVVKLNHINSKVGKRLVVIGESRYTGIFAEYRNALNKEGKGVLLYRLDTNIPHGSGPIHGLVDLLSTNESKEYFGFRFKVAGADKDSVYLSISKI